MAVTKFTEFQLYPVMINHFKQFWKVYAWCVLITVLSCLPADNKGPDLFNFQHADKILHILFYGIFSGLIIISVSQTTGNQRINIRTVVFAFVLVLSYGTLMEFLQHYFITTRTGDPFDILFNVIGWGIATTVLYLRAFILSRNN